MKIDILDDQCASGSWKQRADSTLTFLNLKLIFEFLQSGLDDKWWSDSMECSCYLRNVQDLLWPWVRSMRSTRTMCLSTEERQTTDMDWLNSELYALLSIKTAETAMALIKSLEEVEVKGIIGWHRLEREARVYHRHRVAPLKESVTHLERVLKVTDLPQAFYRWESSLKEFQRGRPAELDDDVKANSMRHMMPKEILDAVHFGDPSHLGS